MANEKTLKTRIKLRYDSYNNWKTQNPVLLSGEIAIVAVATNETPDKDISTIDNQTKDLNLIKPAILFKVGDHTTHFNDLPWASGMAADVYNWAKKDGIEITDSTQGNFLTDVKWEGDKLVLTRGTVKSTITPNVTSDGVITHTSKEGENGFTLDLKHAKKGPSTEYTKAASTTTINGSGATGTITVPQITVDQYGHVTKASNESISITMPTIPGITVTPNAATGNHPTANEVIVLSDISASGHTITQTGVKVPTKQYVDNQIAEKVSGAVQYLGLVHTVDGINHQDGNPSKGDIKNSIGKGDYYRVASDFALKSLTTANKVQFTPDPASDTYKAVRIQEGTARLVGIHDKNGLHRFDQNNTVTDIDRDTAEYEFADGQRTPLLVTADLEGPVIAPDPKTFDGQFTHLHPGDLLVAANERPTPQEADDTASSPDGYYVVHGEEIGVSELNQGKGIIIDNPQSSIPTINHGKTGSGTAGTYQKSNEFIKTIQYDEFGHIVNATTAVVSTHDSQYTSTITGTTNPSLNLVKDGTTTVSTHKISGASGASVEGSSNNLTVKVVDYSNLLTSKNGNNGNLINENGDFIILDGGAANTW